MRIEVRTPDGVEECSIEELERRLHEGELDASTLVRIDAVTGDRFAPLRSLELYLGLANPEEQSWREQLRTAAPVVTAALVGVQIRIYLWTKVPGTLDRAVDDLTNWAPAVIELGEVHRLLSYGLLHTSFSHLAVNLLFLGYAGASLERALGRLNMLLIFAVSVLCGGILSMALSGGRPALGASGGDFGLLAAALVFGVRHESLLPITQRARFGWAILPYILYPLASGWLSSAVDNWGHLGGLLGGGGLAMLLEPESFARSRASNRAARRWAAGAAGAALLSLWAISPWLIPLEPIEVSGLRVRGPAQWAETWTFSDDWGRVSPTRLAAFTATRRTYDAPLELKAAEDALIEQLDDRASAVTRARSEPRLVGGLPALVSRVEFSLDGVDQVVYALLIPRGAHVYRVTLQCRARERARCGTLAERVFASAEPGEPPELVEARARYASNPGSAAAALSLGIAAANAGLPDLAEDALGRAYAAERSGALAAALLELYADYPKTARLNSVHQMVADHPDDVEVVIAAIAALDRLGARTEAAALLGQATARWPEDPGLRRAIRRSP